MLTQHMWSGELPSELIDRKLEQMTLINQIPQPSVLD